MIIEFDNVIPYPLKLDLKSECQLWGKKIQFLSHQNSLLEARSGKGKSTFTCFLSGIRSDFNGTINIDNRNINSYTINDWSQVRRDKLSFIFQDLQLFDQLSVGENLLIKNRLTDFKTENEIKNIIGFLGLEGRWNQICGTLSLGQQQRVAIARSLLQPANFLIMDEPFSHLDEKNKKIAFELIFNHCKINTIGMILTSLDEDFNLIWENKIQIA
jgi:putative ABC transport system ATP-binding protein